MRGGRRCCPAGLRGEKLLPSRDRLPAAPLRLCRLLRSAPGRRRPSPCLSPSLPLTPGPGLRWQEALGAPVPWSRGARLLRTEERDTHPKNTLKKKPTHPKQAQARTERSEGAGAGGEAPPPPLGLAPRAPPPRPGSTCHRPGAGHRNPRPAGGPAGGGSGSAGAVASLDRLRGPPPLRAGFLCRPRGWRRRRRRGPVLPPPGAEPRARSAQGSGGKPVPDLFFVFHFNPIPPKNNRPNVAPA